MVGFIQFSVVEKTRGQLRAILLPWKLFSASVSVCCYVCLSLSPLNSLALSLSPISSISLSLCHSLTHPLTLSSSPSHYLSHSLTLMDSEVARLSRHSEIKNQAPCLVFLSAKEKAPAAAIAARSLKAPPRPSDRCASYYKSPRKNTHYRPYTQQSTRPTIPHLHTTPHHRQNQRHSET